MRWRRFVFGLALMAAIGGSCSGTTDHPGGWKAVDYQGVRLFVPDQWPVITNIPVATLSCGGTNRYAQPVVLLAAPTPQPINEACAVDWNSASPSGSALVVLVTTAG